MFKQFGGPVLGALFGGTLVVVVLVIWPHVGEIFHLSTLPQSVQEKNATDCLHEPNIEVSYPERNQDLNTAEVPPEKTAFTVKNGDTVLGTFTLQGPRVDEIMKQMGCVIYFRASTTGLGGYILYGALADPWYRVDLMNRVDEPLSLLPVPNYFSIEDISPDQSMIAVSDHERHAVVILDAKGKELMRFAVPMEYEQFGDVAFSPNGKKVAYAAATGNPDDEQGEVFIIDLISKNQESGRSKIGGYFNLNGWRDNQSPYVIEH